jgi:hypothetical protein
MPPEPQQGRTPCRVGRQHRHQGLDDAGGRIELAALLALGAGELPEEVFVDLAQHVARRIDPHQSRWWR